MIARALISVAVVAAAVSLTAQQRTGGTIVLPEPDSPFVAFNIWIKAGSQNDPAGKEGLAAVTAALLAEGATTEDSYDQIRAKLYPMAAGYGATTDKEMTVFRGVVHRDHVDAYYRLFGNAFLRPAFAEADFARVKTRTLNDVERTRRYARDEELSKDLLFREAYRGTPYEHPVDGYVSSVRAITLDDVKAFHARYYVRNNIVVGVGGGYPDGLVQRVRGDVDRLPDVPVPPVPAPRPRMPDGIHVLIVDKPTDATAISLGFPIALVRGQPDFFAMMAANSWFGEHRNPFSHLYQVLRESRGVNYGDYSYIEAFPLGYATQVPPVHTARRSHLFEIWIRPVSRTSATDLHDRALFTTRAAWRELKTLADDGLTAQALADAQQFLSNFSLNYAQTVSRRLSYAIDDAFYDLAAPGFLASIRPGLARLDRAGVNAAITRHLQADNMYVVFITQDAEAFKRKLLSGEPTPITYAGERPAALRAEDEIIARFPLPVRPENVRIESIDQVLER